MRGQTLRTPETLFDCKLLSVIRSELEVYFGIRAECSESHSRASRLKVPQLSKDSRGRLEYKDAEEEMTDFTKSAGFNAALGAFVGACVGDAAGAVLEFSAEAQRGLIPHNQVDWALSMPGGGSHRVGPGQITDDSELALSLAQGLLKSSPPSLPLEAIARNYARWYDSHPFDMGYTCQRAFSVGSGALARGEPVADAILKLTQNRGSSESQANGALMRCVPLAIWSHRRPDKEIASNASQDACLSHPNRVCQDANAAYCIAIGALIRNPRDAEGAIQAASNWCRKSGGGDIQRWLHEALSVEAIPPVAGEGKDGWVRWGFTLSFRHLALKSSYEAALRDVLARGGDVDTNAAIVGGMVGALNGASRIAEALSEPVLRRDSSSKGRQVPDYLLSCQVPKLTEDLFRLAVEAST